MTPVPGPPRASRVDRPSKGLASGQDMSRRRFLRTTAAAVAAMAASGLPAPPALANDLSRRQLADLHVHPLIASWIRYSAVGTSAPALADLAENLLNHTDVSWERAWRAGIDMMAVAHFNLFDEFASMPVDPNPDAPRQALRMLDQLEFELSTTAAPYAELARTPADLKRLTDARKTTDDGEIHPDYRIAVVHTLEGGHHLGGSPDAVRMFADRGVALITVTHFFGRGVGASGNAIPFFPDAFTPPPRHGLTALGADIVSAMNDAGVLVDVSHAAAPTVADVLRVSRYPVLATHSSVAALGAHPYSLPDELIQEIASRGGVVGVILMPYFLGNYATQPLARAYGGLDDVVRTTQHVGKLTGGFDHVAIGTDFEGYIPGPYDIERVSQIGRLRARLVHAFGERAANAIIGQNAIDFLVTNWGAPCPEAESDHSSPASRS